MLSGLGGQITTNNGKDCLMQLYLAIQDKAAPIKLHFCSFIPSKMDITAKTMSNKFWVF
jgi:hypothetical protein